MSKKGKLFVVSAPSGAGKTTLCEQLLKALPNLVRSISLTTRKARSGEKEGYDYFFVSEEDFKKKIKNKELLEYAKVFGEYYGTPRKFVVDNLRQNKDVLLNIDVQGAIQIRKNFKKDSVLIFILPPSLEDLEKRLTKRKTDTEEQIQQRLKVAIKELSHLKYYDYQIINDDLKEAFQKLRAIIISTKGGVRK